MTAPGYLKDLIVGLSGNKSKETDALGDLVYHEDYAWGYYFRCVGTMQYIKWLGEQITAIEHAHASNQTSEEFVLQYDRNQYTQYTRLKHILVRSLIVDLWACLHDSSGEKHTKDEGHGEFRSIRSLSSLYSRHHSELYDWFYTELSCDNVNHDNELKRLLDNTAMGEVVTLKYSWPVSEWQEWYTKLQLLTDQRPKSIINRINMLRNNRFAHMGNRHEADRHQLTIEELDEVLRWMHDWLEAFTLVTTHASIGDGWVADPQLIIKEPTYTRIELLIERNQS